MPKPFGELNDLRSQIRKIDDEILLLAQKRQRLAREVGEVKLQAELPIKDYGQEKEILLRCQKYAKDLGIYSGLAEDLVTTLIKYSVQAQEEYHLRAKQKRAAAEGAQKTVGIVGGLGLMGGWLATFFRSFGHNVMLHDIAPARAAATGAPTAGAPGSDAAGEFPLVESLEKLASTADVIVLSTPISATKAILERLTTLRPKGLVFDICSLKSPLLEAIHAAHAAGLRVTSIHPMFGPDVDLMTGRNILFCDAANPDATREAMALFENTTATLVRLPLERHDELMGYVLGLSHLANLVFAFALTKSGTSSRDLMSASSTTFGALVSVAKAVANENQDLYFDIQTENLFTGKVLNGFEEALKEFTEAILGKDRARFKEMMTAGRDYLK